jgi:multidrug efflux pump subunit AcrA (membrane-fusion protein)
MRTKTLLLTAALSAAGVASSYAQVYSVNAVGYVNTVLKVGYNLISNPLNAQDNTIGALFAGLPIGTQIFKFSGGNYVTATLDEFSGLYEPLSARNTTVTPGEGVFVSLPVGSGDTTITFVGEVPQGQLNNALPQGLSIRSSMVPQAGNVDDLLFPKEIGDQIFKYNENTQSYTTFTVDEFTGAWSPLAPILDVGEAVFVSKLAAGSWNRDFSVNTP